MNTNLYESTMIVETYVREMQAEARNEQLLREAQKAQKSGKSGK